MKDRSEIGIVAATTRYEAWLSERIPLVKPDLELKHHAMSAGIFPFLRATFYRWAARWRALVGDVAAAPTVLAVGDLHVENFGTWRDAEGRLVWGVNDFDEAWPLPYTNDLVRLATSALVAREYHDLKIDGKEAVGAILDGYREALERGGHAFVLAEHHTALREMALYRLHDPESFWDKLESLPTVKSPIPAAVLASLRRALPERGLKARIVHRVAGLGSLGRQRFVALAAWRGGRVAREAKALAPLAEKIHYDAILRRGVRGPDPAGVRPQVRGAGDRLRRARVRLLRHAVPGDGATRPAVGSDRPATNLAHHDGDQRPGLRLVRVRPFVRGLVRRPRDLRVRERQHLGGAGVYGRHHVAGGAGPRYGRHRGRVRDRIRARPPDRRARRPLRGSPRARAHRRRAVGRQLLLGERHLAGVARRRAPHGAAVVRLRSHGGSACSKAAAAADACMVSRAVRLRGLHRGPAAAHRQGVRLGSEGAGLAVRPDRCDRRAGSGLPVRSDRAAHGRARPAHRRVVRDGSEHRGAAVGRHQSPGVRLDGPARLHEQPVRTRRVGSRVPLRGPYGTGHDPRGRAGVRRAGPQLRPARRWLGVRRARPAKHVPPRGRGDAAGWTGGAMAAEESGAASD